MAIFRKVYFHYRLNTQRQVGQCGRRDAVFNPRKEVTTRCRVGDKVYRPVTIRYCDASERIYDDIYYAFGEVYCTGEPEPQGHDVTLWAEEGGCGKLYSAADIDLAHAVKEEGKAVPQSRLVLSGKGANDNGDYWRQKPDRNLFDPDNPRLCFVRNIVPERTLGNRLRRPLTYALKAVDIPLSCISVPAAILTGQDIFIQSAPEHAPFADRKQ